MSSGSSSSAAASGTAADTAAAAAAAETTHQAAAARHTATRTRSCSPRAPGGWAPAAAARRCKPSAARHKGAARVRVRGHGHGHGHGRAPSQATRSPSVPASACAACAAGEEGRRTPCSAGARTSGIASPGTAPRSLPAALRVRADMRARGAEGRRLRQQQRWVRARVQAAGAR